MSGTMHEWIAGEHLDQMMAEPDGPETIRRARQGIGTAVEPRNMNRQWEKVRDRAGTVRPARLHDLRHACASYALHGGADLETVRGMLRHSRISTTMVYVHALEDVPRAGADVMDRVLEGLRRR